MQSTSYSLDIDLRFKDSFSVWEFRLWGALEEPPKNKEKYN